MKVGPRGRDISPAMQTAASDTRRKITYGEGTEVEETTGDTKRTIKYAGQSEVEETIARNRSPEILACFLGVSALVLAVFVALGEIDGDVFVNAVVAIGGIGGLLAVGSQAQKSTSKTWIFITVLSSVAALLLAVALVVVQLTGFDLSSLWRS